MIRLAKPLDHAGVRAVVSAAFDRADEADLVERLRGSADLLFELVEIEGEAVVGHIAYSRLRCAPERLWAALAPLSVRPGRQRTGVGKRLTAASLDEARRVGVGAVLVLGHPRYYPKFGFSREAARSVSSAFSASPAFMALALSDGALETCVAVTYPAAFDEAS